MEGKGQVMDSTKRRAVIIGAGIAGLLTARVLSEYYAEVILVERDGLPARTVIRKGTPHAAHTHAMLIRGSMEVEDLFPGFHNELIKRGGVIANIQSGVPILCNRHRLAFEAGDDSRVFMSRPAMEAELRRQVTAIDNVFVMENIDVIQPCFDAEHQCVTGVSIRTRQLEGKIDPAYTPFVTFTDNFTDNGDILIAADFVVDASGRGSQASKWLSDWGLQAPEEDRVRIGLAYMTAYFKRDPNKIITEGREPAPVYGVLSIASDKLPRSAIMLAQESDENGVARWIVTFGGYEGDHPAQNFESFRQCAKLIASSALQQVVNTAQPLSPVMRYQFPFSVRRRYEKLKQHPTGFLVLGDAIASFNPTYGQGMTVAACEAQLLRKLLRKGSPNLQKQFYKAAAGIIAVSWQMSVSKDLSMPSVNEPYPWPARCVNAYLAKLFLGARTDPALTQAFLKVMHMVAPFRSLFAPSVMQKVFFSRHAKQLAPLVNKTVNELK